MFFKDDALVKSAVNHHILSQLLIYCLILHEVLTLKVPLK